MSMPSFAGQSLLPFMARLVLGAAFFFSGWHLCFGTVSLSPDQIDVLEGKTAAVSVALVQVEDKPAAPAAGPEDRPAAMHVALLLDGVGLGDWAIASAWAVSVIELIGGALLVIGLLTRATSLVLAVLLGLAFWVSSVHTAGMFELDPLAWASDSRTFYEMFSC